MNNFKERCVALRKKGYSIIEIMKVTGRAKTSIYTHIKNIPLSDERIEQYRAASGERIRKFALARKGKSSRAFREFAGWNTQTVLLVAHLLFDGEIHENRGCAYNNRSEALIERVRQCMLCVYGFEPKKYTNPHTGVHRISYYNVALAIYIKRKAKSLLKEIESLPIVLQREFVRAFFDDEGCMDFRPGRSRVRGYQKDVKILEIIKTLLNNFGISARIQLPNEVVIVGKENLIQFEREINFSPGIYVNGNRSNSIWKKHIEKRELLKRAIKSFKN